jgi:hypothetical protein
LPSRSMPPTRRLLPELCSPGLNNDDYNCPALKADMARHTAGKYIAAETTAGFIRSQIERIELFRNFQKRLIDGVKLPVPSPALDLSEFLQVSWFRVNSGTKWSGGRWSTSVRRPA